MRGTLGKKMRMRTYTVQVEGVGAAGCVGVRGEGDLDGRVLRERIDATGRQEVLGGLRAAQDLQEDGDGGRNKGGIVDEEVRGVETKGHVEGQVDTALLRSAGLP